jgi:hypothetical protein
MSRRIAFNMKFDRDRKGRMASYIRSRRNKVRIRVETITGDMELIDRI